jgi:hypothetical protein
MEKIEDKISEIANISFKINNKVYDIELINNYKNLFFEIYTNFNIGKEIFLKFNDTLKQGKIIYNSPNYFIEVVENKKTTQYPLSNTSEYKLVNQISNIDLSGINYKTDKFIIYYHDQCNDGITSSWVINKFLHEQDANFDNIEFIPIHASKENQGSKNRYDNKDSIILFLDVTPSVENYKKLIKNNKRVYILDHHITSLKAFFPLLDTNKNIIFDLYTSGAGLTWNSFFAGQEIPEFIKLVIKHDIYTQEDGDNTDSFFLIYSYLLRSLPINDDNKHGLDDIIDKKSKKINEIENKINTQKLPSNYLLNPPKDYGFDTSIDTDVIGSTICLKKDLHKCGQIIEINQELDGIKYLVKFSTGEPELIQRNDIMFKETITTKYKKGDNYFIASTTIFEKFKRKNSK